MKRSRRRRLTPSQHPHEKCGDLSFLWIRGLPPLFFSKGPWQFGEHRHSLAEDNRRLLRRVVRELLATVE